MIHYIMYVPGVSHMLQLDQLQSQIDYFNFAIFLITNCSPQKDRWIKKLVEIKQCCHQKEENRKNNSTVSI